MAEIEKNCRRWCEEVEWKRTVKKKSEKIKSTRLCKGVAGTASSLQRLEIDTKKGEKNNNIYL